MVALCCSKLSISESIVFYTFSLPHKITCPGKTPICEEYCYEIKPEEKMMKKSENVNTRVLVCRKCNYIRTLDDSFVNLMLDEICKITHKENQRVFIRIHLSGDFYSKKYMLK